MGSLDEERGEGGSGRNPGNNHGGPCKTCVDIAKWFPVVFIVAVISWSYYAFVIQLCLLTMSEIWLKILSLTIYHIVLALFLWSYWQTIFSKSGRVPRKFRIPPTELDRVESAQSEQEVNTILGSIVQGNQLPIQTRTNISQIRYCEKCSIIKPDRCHHCSVCGRCILKMDHHCPWVNNCVCFDNYKFFVLFLVYAFLYCFVVFLFSLPYFIQFWSRDWNGNGNMGGKFHVLFVFFVAAMFAVSLVSLFGYHCYLITKNRSTLESFRSPIFTDGPDIGGFSLGTYHNFVEIFGEDKRIWFLPIFTSLGDGIVFPTARQTRPGFTGNYNSIDTTETSATTPPPDYDQCIDVRVDANNPGNNPNPTDPRSPPSQLNGHRLLNQGNGNRSPPAGHQGESGENESPLVYF